MLQDRSNSALVGSKYLFYSVSCFALVNASVKFLSHIHFSEVVFFRALVSLLLCVWGIRAKGLSFLGNNRRLLIGRGIAGTIALTLFFYVLQTLPLATAVTLQYLSPIFTVIWAHLLFREKASLVQWLFFSGGFLGVYLIQGFDPRVDAVTALIGVLSAMASGLAYTFVRRLKDTDHELVIIFYFPMITLPVLFPFLLAHWTTPGLQDIFFLLLIGVATQGGQIFLTRAYALRKAADIGLVNYIGVLYAVLMGWAFFGEAIGPVALLGIVLILVSISGGQLWVKWKSRESLDSLH